MGEYSLFIGCKLIEATECARMDAYRYLNRPHAEDGTPEDGFLVRYEDGYMSWSPKDVFERCYRKLSVGEKELVYGKPINIQEPPQVS